jgi:hypothetical protein
MIQINANRFASCEACGKRPDAIAIHLSNGDRDFTLCTQCGVDLANIITKFVTIVKDKSADTEHLVLTSKPKSKRKRKR